MKKILEGRTALITGCNRGMGSQMMELFAQNGAAIVACARKQTDEFESRIQLLAKENEVEITPVYFDLANMDSVKEAGKEIVKRKMHIDAMVNNAGIIYSALFQMTTLDKWQEVFQINYFAPMIFTQYIVKLMVKFGGGSIVNIASSTGIDANPGRSAYGASKAAVICTTKTMADELGRKRIRVNAIAPGMIDTDMVAESMSGAMIEETIQQTILKRIGKPIDVANAAMFLCSDLASYVTGQVIRVDGGLRK